MRRKLHVSPAIDRGFAIGLKMADFEIGTEFAATSEHEPGTDV